MSSLFPNGIQGLADSKWQGKAGSVAKIVGIDYRTTPGVFKAHQKLTKNSSTTVTELCKARVACSDGSTLWFSSESGKIWREVAGTYTLVYTTTIEEFDLLTAVATGNVGNVVAKATFPKAVFRSNGLQAFVLDYVNSANVHSYTLSTAWDVTTLTFVETYDMVTQVGSSAKAFFVRADGLKMYGCSATAVFQYSLSAWDASTSSYESKTFSFAAQVSNCEGIWFKDDGAKMYVKDGSASGTVYQYTLATPWDVNTASYDSVSYTFSGITSWDFAFNDDGSKIYVATSGGTAGNSIMQYSVATPWSLASVSYEDKRLVLATNTSPASVSFAADGSNVFVPMFNTGEIHQYSLADGTEEVKTLDAIEYESRNILAQGLSLVTDDYSRFIYWTTEYYVFRVPVANLADWDGFVLPAGRFVNGDDTYHPMTYQNVSVFIGDKNVIASIEGGGVFTAETTLNLPELERVTALEPFDLDILIGTKWGGLSRARVIRWDGISTSWSTEDILQESAINAFIRDDNYVYANAGEYGRLYFYNGEKMEPFRRIPGSWSPTAKGVIYPNAVGFHLGIPVIGVSNITGNPTEQGVYGFGSYSRDYAKTLSLDFPISTDEFSGVTIGAILVKDFDLYVAWKSATGVGVDKLDWSNKYASAFFETTMLSSVDQLRNVFKTLARFYAAYSSLPTSTAVSMSYKKKHEANFASLTNVKDAGLSLIQSNKTVPNIANLQLKVGLTVDGNNSPEIEDVGIDWVGKKRTI